MAQVTPTPLRPTPGPATQRNNMFSELGGSGLRIQSGALYEEFRTELRGLRGVAIYNEMANNSAIVGAILFTIEQMMLKVNWEIKPFSNEGQDKEPADFISQCLFDDMNRSWADTLSEICTMFPFGWAYMEVVYKMRNGLDVPDDQAKSKFNDNKIGWRKWALRSQDTLYRWEMDQNDGILAMTQQLHYPVSRIITIPIQKALLFRTRIEKNNPEGRSLLRNAYTAWWYAKRFQDIEAIAIERDLAGLPVLTPPDGLDIWNPNDPIMADTLRKATNMVQQIRRGEREGLIKPFGWELELLSSASRRPYDITTTINRYETRMAMSVLADFVFLGSGSAHGSWALSSNKTQMFMLAMEGYLRRIKEVVNRHAIPMLMEMNNMDITRQPRLEHGDIQIQDLAMLAQYITALANTGAVTFPDEELERYLRLAADLPPPPEDPETPVMPKPPVTASQLMQSKKPAAPAPKQPAQSPNGNQPPPQQPAEKFYKDWSPQAQAVVEAAIAKATDHSQQIIVEDDGGPQGFVQLTPYGSQLAIEHFVTNREDMAEALFKRAAQLARKQKMTLVVTPANDEAADFYEAQGMSLDLFGNLQIAP